ncbi:gem-associated protein 2 [Anoplophora glabripennis]|nr:gem-associated protein 2 [Anoplophora glabripennis]
MSESDTSEEECEGLLKKALQVEFPENFNPNSVPQNGQEYLHHVIYERRRCRKLVTANIDTDRFKSKQTIHIALDNSKKEAPKYCIPSEEWQIEKLNDFSEFRQYVHSKILEEPTETNFDELGFIERIKGETPVFSEITKYSQSSKIRMLQIITKYLDNLEPGESIYGNMGTWVYAILTLLEKPLSPSYCHTIREFAKRCSVVRFNLSETVEESAYTPLNLYICLIAKYFNQLDLAD